MSNIEEEGYFAASAMVKFGGSFVKCLGEALYHADTSNAKKIKAAFPEYWEKYLKLAHDEEAAEEQRE